ncbi:MAG: efflux transporter outer membrane subunit [Vicinamibacterales bacterium]
MERFAAVWPLALACTLTGCVARSAMPHAAHPAEPVAWTSVADGVDTAAEGDLSAWWSQLGDETLTMLIEDALRESPTIQLAQARLRQARAQEAQAAAALWPTVDASGSASGRQSGNRVFSPDGSQTVVNNVLTGSYGGSMDASWEPDVFGTTRRGVDAARADLAAVAADLQATHVSLAAEVALTYAQLRALQERLEIARGHEASQAETLTLTDFRAQAGLVGSLDVEQARSNLAQTRAQIPSLESSRDQAALRLAVLRASAPGALKTLLAKPAPLPAVPERIAVGIPADVLRQRPDVRAAELRIVAETARLAQAGARRFPRFSLSGTLGIEVLTGGLTGGTNTVASIATALSQTVFDGGRIRQQIAIQSAVQEQAVASYESAVLTALEDVERALVALEASRQRLQSLEIATTAAENAALLAHSQYSAGLADFQTVLNTERSALTLQDSVVQTEGDRLNAVIQLYKALGGGWTSAQATSPPTEKASS